MIQNTLIRIGIQKRGGHLLRPTQEFLSSHWNLQLPENAGTKGHELSKIVVRPNGEQIGAQLLMCRIEDIVMNVFEGDLDIGIVSSDVLAEFHIAAGTLLQQPDIKKRDVGFAGSRLMIGVAETFLKANPQLNQEEGWRAAVTQSYNLGLPIVTSFKEDLIGFLREQGIQTMPRIAQRRGTVEAQGRMANALVIADLVKSGQSMLDEGYVPFNKDGQPFCPIGESRTLILARIPRLDPTEENPRGITPKRTAMLALLNAQPLLNTYTAPA